MWNAFKEVWYLVAAVAIVITAFISVQYIHQQKINQHLENLNVKFSGVITQNTLMPNHCRLLSIDISEATPTHYDVRKTEAVYFCVIKGDKAEFVFDIKNQLEVGDSISVIPNPMRLINYNKKTIQTIELSPLFGFSLFKDLKEYHEL